MPKFLRASLLFALTACVPLAQPVRAGNLVDVHWLERNLKSPDVLILDASPTPVYTANHIPGALSVDLFRYGLPDASTADTEKRFQGWGVSSGKRIVLYDEGGGMMAPRLFFSLLYYGFPAKDLLILDGGLFQWQKQGLPVTKESPPVPKQGSFQVTKRDEEVRAGLPEVLEASGDRANHALLEALGPDWHFGEVLAFHKAGHIPNGILAPADDFYKPDKTFKSPEELQQMMTYLGIKREQQIETYCGGGFAASVPFFALKFILNYPKVKLYQESEMGWLSDERDLPYWTYDAPSLMRDTNWLQSWGSQRMKMYGAARVSILDVRPAAEFAQGHVRLALSVPADVFQSNLATPRSLAKVLKADGVSEFDEAVIVSGAGLTKESALAFVMMETLGQRKVSVFLDSMEKWAKLGFAVAKDPAVPGSEPVPEACSRNFRHDVVITDPKSTQGVYPKVFVASGKGVPERAPEGKVVHVPYTDLLNADGTPKAAKDLWNILEKAGVPRYAELICFSDDPGEAAVDYFIFKLMGYPDLKVLATS